MNIIENEFHFLIVRPLYNNLRRKYFKPYYWSWPTLNKFDRLMTSENKKKEILNLSIYIFLQINYEMTLKIEIKVFPMYLV